MKNIFFLNQTDKINTHLKKNTHYNQTLKHNERGGNVHFFHWVTDAGMLLFLKRNENILQLTADDVNFLSKQNMQMKYANTIK